MKSAVGGCGEKPSSYCADLGLFADAGLSDPANLRLTVSKAGPPSQDGLDSDVGIIQATRSPLRSKICGYVSSYGTISLTDCFQYNVSRNHVFETDITIYQIDLQPSQIWLGNDKEMVENRVFYAIARDSRLSGYFASPGLETYRSWDESSKEAFEHLGNPDEIWTLKNPQNPSIELKNTPFVLRISSGISHTTSSTEGSSLRSNINLTLESKRLTSIAEASDALFKLEQILSVFALEPFTFQVKEYRTNLEEEQPVPASVALVWQLGEKRDLFKPPMRHQILVNLSDYDTLQSVCDGWFDASRTMQLSRWLFVRALNETDDGLARFIAVAQAFEVLGRELDTTSKMPKAKLRRAVELVREGLSSEFDGSFVERIVSLVQSSNKASFRDVLYSMISEANPEPEHDLMPLCRTVSDTRNAVIHMTTNSKDALNEAFRRVNKLSLLISFWYAVVQAHQLNLSVPDMATFLFNNRNARHGLPNELL
jgi:hypothetical protein